MTVTVEHDHLSPRGTGQTVPMYRCHCGELHNSAQSAHACRHRAMPKSHDRQSAPSLFDQEAPDHA